MLCSPTPLGVAAAWLRGDFAQEGGLGLGTFRAGIPQRVLLSMDKDWDQDQTTKPSWIRKGLRKRKAEQQRVLWVNFLHS